MPTACHPQVPRHLRGVRLGESTSHLSAVTRRVSPMATRRRGGAITWRGCSTPRPQRGHHRLRERGRCVARGGQSEHSHSMRGLGREQWDHKQTACARAQQCKSNQEDAQLNRRATAPMLGMRTAASEEPGTHATAAPFCGAARGRHRQRGSVGHCRPTSFFCTEPSPERPDDLTRPPIDAGRSVPARSTRQ